MDVFRYVIEHGINARLNILVTAVIPFQSGVGDGYVPWQGVPVPVDSKINDLVSRAGEIQIEILTVMTVGFREGGEDERVGTVIDNP